MSTTSLAAVDDRVMAVWEWCSEAYLQNGMRISFPANTDPHKTYQWRFVSSIANKFNEWGFDDETAKRFIAVAVREAKQRGVLKKGLAALHQSNMLDICYQIVTSQQKDNIGQIDSLTPMKQWFDSQIGNSDPLKILLHRRDRNSLSNIVTWYQASKLSDLFLALSKVCNQAVARLQDNVIERRLLPATTTLYLIRSEFLAERNNMKAAKTLFGTDWRKS